MNSYYSRLKRTIRERLQLQLFEGPSPIVIASTGRAASTLLYKAIRAGYIRARFNVGLESIKGRMLFRLSGSYVNRLQDIENDPAAVFKTHCLWSPDFRPQAKFIFIHGDPLESALSVDLCAKKREMEWFNQHQYHLEATGAYSDLFHKDVLNYEEQIISWGRADDERILCVSYEELWKRITQISGHVGFEVNLVPFGNRTRKRVPEDINEELFERLRRIRGEVFSSENLRFQEVPANSSEE